MANSLTTLVKAGTGLKEVTSEDLASRAKDLGLPAAPTNPLSAAAIGANPDQAKMAGTTANKKSVMRDLADPSQSISTFERTKQDKAVQPGQSQFQRKNELTELALGWAGDLSNRTNALKSKVISSAQTTVKPTLNSESWAAAKPAETSDADWAAATGSMQSFLNGNASSQDFVNLSKALGKASVKAEDLQKFVSGDEKAIAASLAAASPDKISATELLRPDELKGMSELLGISEDQIKALSASGLQEKIDQIKSQEFSNASVLLESAFDPTVSPAERAAARSMLRESGTTGQRMLEDRMAQVGEDVREASTITVAGEEVPIEEAFSDEGIQGLVARAFQETGFMAKLEKQEPELFELIQENQKSLSEWAKTAPAQLKEYSTIQEANASANKLPSGETLSNSTMKLMVPNWGEAQATKYVEPPILSVLKNPAVPPEQRQVVSKLLGDLTSTNPALVKQMADWDYEKLASSGLTTPAGREKFLDNLTTYSSIENVAPKASPATYIQTVFGKSTADLQSDLTKLVGLVKMGQGGKEAAQMLALLDVDKNGKMDDLDVVNERVKSFYGKNRDVNTILASGIPSVKDLLNKATSANVADPLYNTVAPFIVNGQIPEADLPKITGGRGENLSYAELAKLKSSFPWVKQQITQIETKKREDQAVNEIMNGFGDPDIKDWTSGAVLGKKTEIGPLDHAGVKEKLATTKSAIDQLRKLRQKNPSLDIQIVAAINGLAEKQRKLEEGDAWWNQQEYNASEERRKRVAAQEARRSRWDHTEIKGR